MTPEDVAKRCAEWADNRPRIFPGGYERRVHLRRVECAEPDGPRRCWVLFEGGRQVGHVRGRERIVATRSFGDQPFWTWEAANAGRDILGLPAYNAAEEASPRDATSPR